jgi:hypothetical protein
MVYSSIDSLVEGEDAPSVYRKQKFFFFGSSMDYAIYQFTNLAFAHLNNKLEQQRIEMERARSITKLEMVITQYKSSAEYPEKILDGWHNVIATDNSNFCKDAKVLIKGNKVQRFVIEDYLPVNFLPFGEIKKAKTTISLQNFNNEQLSILELYFIYDIDEQIVIPEPPKPCFVCFWTDMLSFNAIKISLDNIPLENFITRFDSIPAPFQNGSICRIIKPGLHSVMALGRGAIDWKDPFEIRPGQCLRYRLGRH